MSLRVAVVPNDEKGFAYITEVKKRAKAISRWGVVTVRVRTYGRCHDKVKAFATTGRRHSRNSNSNSIYSLKAPEAKFCYAWAVYLDISVKPVKSQAYPDGKPEMPGERY